MTSLTMNSKTIWIIYFQAHAEDLILKTIQIKSKKMTRVRVALANRSTQF